MARLSITLDKRRATKNGNYPIRLSIFHNNSTSFIVTGIEVKEEYFDGRDIAHSVKSKCPNAKAINEGIEDLYIKMFERLKELERGEMIDSLSASQLRDAITSKVKTTTTFTDYLLKKAREKNAINTYKTYLFTLQALQKFFNKQAIQFNEINYKSLAEFESASTLSDSSKGMVLRQAKTIINAAIEDNLIPKSSNLDKLKIKTHKPHKEFMPIHTMRAMLDLDLKGEHLLARDFFMLSFYLCGINPIDLFTLKQSKGYIRYERTKTRIHNLGNIIVKIQPEAQAIIDKYKGKEHLLSFSESNTDYHKFMARIMRRIKEVGKMVDYESITLYHARYSWATYALNYCDVSEYVIGKALGHSDASTASRFYISFDWAKVDAANRKVIDYLNQ